MLNHDPLNQIQVNLANLSQNFVFKEPTFRRDHIFYSVLNACINDVSATEKMAMYNLFYCYEKALFEARVRHYHMAKYWVRYVDRKREAFSPLANLGLSALYYPMVAFIDYVTKNHEEALTNLNKSLELFDDLKKKGVKDVIGAATEQNLNKFRVYCSMSDYPKAITHASGLLLFVTNATRNKTPDFPYDIMEMVDLSVENDWEGVTHYFINAVMAKFPLIETHADRNEVAKFWQDFYTADNWDKSSLKEIRPAGKILSEYYSDNKSHFLNGILDHFNEISQWPMQLQSFLFEKVIGIGYESGYSDITALEQILGTYTTALKNDNKEISRDAQAA